MTIKYLPDEMLAKLAPPKKIEKMISGKLTVNRAALSMLDNADFIDKREVTSTVLKVSKFYKERYKDQRSDGATKAEALELAVNEKKLLVQRVQNSIVWQVSQQIKKTYEGEKYRWLPSDAEDPRPEHQLNYGKTFIVGDGEMPGEEPGCKCGMEILVRDKELKL